MPLYNISCICYTSSQLMNVSISIYSFNPLYSICINYNALAVSGAVMSDKMLSIKVIFNDRIPEN